ncbi:MAG TPA: CDP-alcohol phosphatidyltransferase family protein [Gammaproteobacteria bacterium]|nr:CDP-alcohol phosphatidyltransferase family protein [Gammaproteobacteria bacterium]
MIKEKSQLWALASKKLGEISSKLPFSPNHYTWMTIPIALIGMGMMIYGWVWCSTLLFLIAGVCDLIDGALARHLNCASSKGAFLDGSLDRFIDSIILFSYFWLPLELPWLLLGQWIYIALFFAIMPSFIVAYANHRQAVVDPEEKIIWRILNRGEMFFFMLLIPILSLYNTHWASALFIVFIGLSILTTLQVLFRTLHLAEK